MKYEQRQIRDANTITQIIWCLVKAFLKHGNKKLLTSSYQRLEILEKCVYMDDKKDILYIPGT